MVWKLPCGERQGKTETRSLLVCYEKCNESKSMRKPRKGKVRCEKQAVTFVSVASVTESCLPATSSPVLSGAEFIADFYWEQVNLSASGKMETGNMGIGWMPAGRGR